MLLGKFILYKIPENFSQLNVFLIVEAESSTLL